MKKILFQLMICVAILIGTNGNDLMAQDPDNSTFFGGDVEKVLDEMGDYSEYAHLDGESCPIQTPKTMTCTRMAFVVKDIELDERYYVRNAGDAPSPLKYMITGYYWVCQKVSIIDGKIEDYIISIEIVDIIPMLANGETYTDSWKSLVPEYMGYLIQKAQLGVFIKMANNLPITGVADKTVGDMYVGGRNKLQTYSKSCYKALPIMRLSDPVTKDWEPIKIDPDWEIPVSKVNANSSKNDELQTTKYEDDYWDLSDEYVWQLTPCKATVCCEYQYNVVLNHDDDKNIYTMNSLKLEINDPAISSPIEACADEKNANGVVTDKCNAVCEYVQIDGPNPKSPFPSLNGIINPNPNSGQMVLNISGTLSGTINIAVTDISGNIVYHTDIEKTSDEIAVEVNLQTLMNGNYYYNLSKDGVQVGNGSFIISK